MNKRVLVILILCIYLVATYYSFESHSIWMSLALQAVTNISSFIIGCVLGTAVTFISKLPH